MRHLFKNSSSAIQEILLVDGGSTDETLSIARNYKVTVIHSEKGRSKQLNSGARKAQGDILYFLHADTLPPKGFDNSIIEAVENGHPTGCFQMKFDSKSRFLSFFAWFSRINHIICRGGDQSLFIAKKLFELSGGFNEAYRIYEDSEYIGRLYKITPFKILSQYVKTSARRYEERGKLTLQYHFGVIHLKNYLGAGPEHLYDYYKRKIIS
ncbi:MAG: glycosyltransferase family 2 protein [Pricia sp.]|nr:glycosyltransferase family 2 protein [Pricia sp.]